MEQYFEWNTISLFHVTGLFQYVLKTREKQRFFDIFRGYENSGIKWIKGSVVLVKYSRKKVILKVARQPPEVFCKKRCSKKFRIIHRKTPVLAKACNFIKKRLWHRCFPANSVKLMGIPFSQKTSGGCFWKYQ